MISRGSGQVAIIGVGYVGLVAAAVFSSYDIPVIAADIDCEKIDALKDGLIPLSEDGLLELVKASVSKGFLSFSTELTQVIKQADIIFIAVGTPFDDETAETDMSAVYNILDLIIAEATNKKIVINKSTAPIGTIGKLQDRVKKAGKQDMITLLANPEFLSQGTAVKDFTQAKRVVIGALQEQQEEAEILASLYEKFIARDKIIITDPRTAEISKYAANSLLACKVAFINEVACLADNFSADIKDIANIIGLDPRIGNKFLNAGPGFGGSCFPKDLKALSKTASNLGLDLPVISAINPSNEQVITYLAEKIVAFICKNSLSNITIWGLAFKAGTDDVRDSQPLKIINYLLDQTNCKISCYDKIAAEKAEMLLGKQVVFADSAESSLQASELLVVLTEWQEFKDFPVSKIKQLMAQANLFDFRNIISKQAAKQAGINFHNFANPN